MPNFGAGGAGIAGLAVRRPVGVSVLFLALFALGVAAAYRMPTALLPPLDVPAIELEVPGAGLTPAEVEELIVRPVEEAAAAVTGVSEVRSVAEAGRARFDVRLAWNANRDVVTLDLLSASRSALPAGVGPPRLGQLGAESRAVVVLALQGLSPVDLQRSAEIAVRPSLERLEGVARVAVVGGARDGLEVAIDRERARARGVGPAAIEAAVRGASGVWATGFVRDRGGDKTLTVAPAPLTADGLLGLALGVGGARLGDVATVRGVTFPARGVVLRDGQPAVLLEVFADAAGGAVTASDAVRVALPSLVRDLPIGARLVLLEDRADFVREALAGVRSAAILGALLASLVLFGFLRRLAPTLAISVAVPVSAAITLLCLDVAGLTLNLMTLGGLALGVGLVVDSSIVVLDNIERMLAAGRSRGDAAIAGANGVTRAIVASTVTTLIVFLPVVYLTGTAAALFREQAVAVGLSLLAALAVALVLTPMLAARGGVVVAGRGPSETAAVGTYRRLVERAVARPWLTVGAAIALTGLSFGLIPQVRFDFLPAAPGEQLIIEYRLPADVTVDGARGELLRMSQAAGAVPGVEHLLLDLRTSDDGRVESARLAITPAGGADRAALRHALRRVVHGIPGGEGRLQSAVNPIALALATETAPFRVDIYAPDDDAVRRLEVELEQRLAELDGFENVVAAGRAAAPRLLVSPRLEQLAASGVSVENLAAAISETLLDVHIEHTATSPAVRIRVDGASRGAAVGDLRLDTAAGFVYLKDFAAVTAGAGPVALHRVHRRRAGSVTADLDGLALSEAIDRSRAVLAGLALPADAGVELSGAVLELRRSARELALAFVLAVLLTYVVLAATFESFVAPVVVLATVPLAAAGVIVPFAASGMPFTVLSLVGLVVLVGIAVNNGILLVDAITRSARSSRSMAVAAVEGATARLRPIAMTTLTSLLAMAPLVVTPAAGGPLAASLAMVLVGGLSASAVLILFVAPALARLVLRELPVTREES